MMKTALVAILPIVSAFVSPLGRNYGQQYHVGMHNSGVVTTERSIILPTCSTKLNLFGALLGNDVKEDGLQENKELARFSNLLRSNDKNIIDVKFDSLSIMISSWSKMFSGDHKKMGLTTAVDVIELPKSDDTAGVQFLFKKGKGGRSAYHDKDEKDDDNNGKEKRQKEETIKEGGLQVIVNKLSDGNLEVIASRCEIEEGTMIKEMSEQTIIDSLGQAMQAWKKEQQ